MHIRIEFFGIPRARAGVAVTEVACESTNVPLGEVLAAVGQRFPQFADECLCGHALRRGFVANLDGQMFVNDPHAAVPAGQTLLLMSADAGG